MSGLILGFFTVVLILICGFITLIVLMQRASSNSGMGAALGGGAAESALGGGASNVLVRGTIIGAALFFIVSFGLYLGYMASYDESQLAKGDALPGMSEYETKAPLPDLTDVPEGVDVPKSTAGSGTTTVDVTAPADEAVESTSADTAAPADTTSSPEEAPAETTDAAPAAQ